MKTISKQSTWDRDGIARFLDDFRAPLRLAVLNESGFPLVCSLWYEYRDGALVCATQKDAQVAEHLRRDAKCGFELGPNEPPYFGVRGHGRATLREAGAAEQLERLIDRFLGDRDGELAQWLLSRADDEVVLAIDVEWITSWDYRDRMEEGSDDSAESAGG